MNFKNCTRKCTVPYLPEQCLTTCERQEKKCSKTLLKANTEGTTYKKQEAEHSTQGIKRIKNLVTIFKTLSILSNNNKNMVSCQY